MKRVTSLLLVFLACICSGAFAQGFPSKPVRLIVPFPPGGDIEPLARILGERLQSVWGQPVLVESKAGAAAIIGTDFVAKSAPDGHTLLMCSAGPIAINPGLYPKLPYNVEKDFDPIALIAAAPMVLLVNDTVPAKNFAEFLAYAKAKPGALTFASSGTGSIMHLTTMLFLGDAGLTMMHVPYKGSAPAIQDLLGGHVNLYFNPMPSALGALKAGKVRALAVTSAGRSPLLPEVPTLDELGIKGFDALSWYGLCAPSGTPRDVSQKIHAEVNRATSQPAIQERLRALGSEPLQTSMEGFQSLVRKDTARWARVIRENTVKVD